MNKIGPETLQKSTEATPVQGGIARRRLLRAGLAAAPVALAVSGRSAMAGTSCGSVKGLSPLAWASMAPNGTCVDSSHTINGNPLGKSPGYWTPNASGQTFQPPYPWPVAPFDKVRTQVGNGSDAVYETKYWNPDIYTDFKGVAANDAGFANGAKFKDVFGGSEGRSFSRILLDESANGNVVWHFSAAYLNFLAMSGQYAMTASELIYLYQNKKLVPGSLVVLTDSEIKTFLDQTWETKV